MSLASVVLALVGVFALATLAAADLVRPAVAPSESTVVAFVVRPTVLSLVAAFLLFGVTVL